MASSTPNGSASNRYYVLADESVQGLSPEGWASRVAAAAARWNTAQIVAEANNGGAMVESVLKAADFGLRQQALCFKLELMQHSGSFKARGAFANLLTRKIPRSQLIQRFPIVSPTTPRTMFSYKP